MVWSQLRLWDHLKSRLSMWKFQVLHFWPAESAWLLYFLEIIYLLVLFLHPGLLFYSYLQEAMDDLQLKRYKLIKMLFLLITLFYEVPFFSIFSSWSSSLSSVHAFHANITQVVLPCFQSLWHRVYAKLTHFSLTTLYSKLDLLADGFSIKMNSTSWKLLFFKMFYWFSESGRNL